MISESQKQARLGWSTMHLARHYTGAVSPEDRRAAEHMDTPSSADERTPVTGQRSRNASLRRPGSHCQSPRRQRLCAGGQCGSLRSGVGAEVSVEESLDSSARDPEAAVDREHRQRQVTPLDGPVDRRSALAQEHRGVLDAEERLGAPARSRDPIVSRPLVTAGRSTLWVRPPPPALDTTAPIHGSSSNASRWRGRTTAKSRWLSVATVLMPSRSATATIDASMRSSRRSA